MILFCFICLFVFISLNTVPEYKKCLVKWIAECVNELNDHLAL